MSAKSGSISDALELAKYGLNGGTIYAPAFQMIVDELVRLRQLAKYTSHHGMCACRANGLNRCDCGLAGLLKEIK